MSAATATVLKFFVEGIPKGKGSFVGIYNQKLQRVILVPAGSADVKRARKQWAKAITDRAYDKSLGPLLGKDEAVSLQLHFYLPRPKAAKKRLWPTKRSASDLDKLCRLVLDALDDANVFNDDSQVCALDARKEYRNENWGVEITVEVLE